jgi:hypothetical protein
MPLMAFMELEWREREEETEALKLHEDRRREARGVGCLGAVLGGASGVGCRAPGAVGCGASSVGLAALGLWRRRGRGARCGRLLWAGGCAWKGSKGRRERAEWGPQERERGEEKSGVAAASMEPREGGSGSLHGP